MPFFVDENDNKDLNKIFPISCYNIPTSDFVSKSCQGINDKGENENYDIEVIKEKQKNLQEFFNGTLDKLIDKWLTRISNAIYSWTTSYNLSRYNFIIEGKLDTKIAMETLRNYNRLISLPIREEDGYRTSFEVLACQQACNILKSQGGYDCKVSQNAITEEYTCLIMLYV